MRELKNHPELCAINTATLGFQAPLTIAIEAIAKAGFGGIAPWRREVEGQDIKALSKQMRDAGLKGVVNRELIGEGFTVLTIQR